MITSIHNPLVKQVRLLLQNARKRKQTRCTVLEGFLTLRHIFANGGEILSVLYAPSKTTISDSELIDQCRQSRVRVEETSEEILDKLSKREGSLGCVAIVQWVERYTLETVPLPTNPLILVAESIEKPGSLGVLVRTSAAAGVDAVILCDPRTVFYDPACVHSSLGSVFAIACITTSTRICREWMEKRGITPVITSPKGKVLYTKQDLTRPCALVVGNEHAGVSRDLGKGGVTVRIDMHGPMDSLNVTVAGALFLFEAVRQRQEKLGV